MACHSRSVLEGTVDGSKVTTARPLWGPMLRRASSMQELSFP